MQQWRIEKKAGSQVQHIEKAASRRAKVSIQGIFTQKN